MARNRKTIVCNVEFPTMPQAMAKLGVDEGGRVQDFVTGEVLRNLPDFMPRESGALIEGMSKTKPTRIRVEGPYARFLFFGVTRAGEPVDFSGQRNPQGGPHWDRRMVAERGAAIVAAANKFVRRRR